MSDTLRGAPRGWRGWRSIAGAWLLVVATIAPVAAHDFWLAPSAYRPKVGALVGLRLLVGQEMIGDPVARDPQTIKRFVVVSGSTEKPVPGRDGGDPAGIVRVDAPGFLIVGYESVPRPVELTPDTFDQYLGEEGLDEIKSLLAARPLKGKVAREIFSRCAKTLLQSGETSPTDHDRALGLSFEIVAERNPYLSAAGRELPFVLTYQGQPRSGALVIAINQRDPLKQMSARSDARGRVVFTLPVGGVWLVKAVHMIPAKAGANADWESFWASLTFELGDTDALALAH